MEKECKVCYKVFFTPIKWNPCCSYDCTVKNALKYKPHRIRYCIICNSPFYFFPYQVKTKCCSLNCAHQSLKGTINYKNRRKVNLHCNVCGKFFQRPHCHVNKEENYCSKICSDLGRRGKPSPLRREKLCLMCGIVVSDRIYGARDYCTFCHHKIVSKWWKENNPMKKKESCLKQSDTRKKMFNDGRLNRFFMREFSDETKKMIAEKRRIRMIEKWKEPEYRDKVITNWLKATQNQPSSYEKEFERICIKNELPFQYVGNGTHLIGGKNPDFIHKDKKICIEVFASFMKIKEFGSVEKWMELRINHFKKWGYITIFFDEKQYNDEDYVVSTLATFK